MLLEYGNRKTTNVLVCITTDGNITAALHVCPKCNTKDKKVSIVFFSLHTRKYVLYSIRVRSARVLAYKYTLMCVCIVIHVRVYERVHSSSVYIHELHIIHHTLFTLNSRSTLIREHNETNIEKKIYRKNEILVTRVMHFRNYDSEVIALKSLENVCIVLQLKIIRNRT